MRQQCGTVGHQVREGSIGGHHGDRAGVTGGQVVHVRGHEDTATRPLGSVHISESAPSPAGGAGRARRATDRIPGRSPVSAMSHSSYSLRSSRSLIWTHRKVNSPQSSSLTCDSIGAHARHGRLFCRSQWPRPGPGIRQRCCVSSRRSSAPPTYPAENAAVLPARPVVLAQPGGQPVLSEGIVHINRHDAPLQQDWRPRTRWVCRD